MDRKLAPEQLLASRLAEAYITGSEDLVVIAASNVLANSITGAWR